MKKSGQLLGDFFAISYVNIKRADTRNNLQITVTQTLKNIKYKQSLEGEDGQVKSSCYF